MSQGPSQAEIVTAFQGLLLDNYIAYAMTALAAYEYTITVKQEMTMVWQHRWTLVAWIFMANRYVMIGIVIWTVAPETAKTGIFAGV
ncbi:hypothetical protein PHLCEN_2v5172 [Hermanssonia centrifuga]|uniref:DUF6533 domain-containing protein n=1 Tax=Hermanssonia centrifuga TaxID=98765 RepID=A0A2R6P8R3_9APHY|nr:hypothetical protein PHLCEN_2v5172 [Hermanssonia centrifuga]